MTAISLQESSRLIELERRIGRGINTFIEVGEALIEIREAKLYRIEHETFEAYCKSKWKFTLRFAQMQMAGARVAKSIATNSCSSPVSESQVRPLSRLKPEQQPTAWERAVEIADGEQPTAKQVTQAVVEISEPSQLGKLGADPIVPKEYVEKDGEALDKLKSAWKECAEHDRLRFLSWINEEAEAREASKRHAPPVKAARTL